MHRTKDVRPATSLDTFSAIQLISSLADGCCATAVHDRAIAPLAAIRGLRSDSIVIGAPAGAKRSQHFHASSDEPSPLVNIEFHQTFVAHFQKEGLARLLVHDIGAFHDLVEFERLLTERVQNFLPIIQHDYSANQKKLTFALE